MDWRGYGCDELVAMLQKKIWVSTARLSLLKEAKELGALVHPMLVEEVLELLLLFLQ